MARAALLVVGIVIGVAHSNPADARKLSGWDLCFSESFPPDRRVATCSAHIRTITHAKASVLLSKAGVYGQKGDYRHAVQDATRSIKLEPSAEAYYTRALAYHNMGRDEAAIRDCNAALAIAPDNENALFVRASAHQGKMDYSEAIQDFTNVLRLDPDRADVFFARGAAYYGAADFERAAGDFSRAIKLGLVDEVVFYLRSLANSELGDGVNLDPDLRQQLERHRARSIHRSSP
jgi:tetratricopeptide (TPR) repeat protein